MPSRTSPREQGRQDRPRCRSGRHRREEGIPPAQPAQARTTHCGPSVRLPQLGGWGCWLPSPSREQKLPLPSLAPGCSGPLKQGHRETLTGSVRPSEPSWREGVGQPHAHITQLPCHMPGGEERPQGDTGRPLKPAAQGATEGACYVLLKSHGRQNGREVQTDPWKQGDHRSKGK